MTLSMMPGECWRLFISRAVLITARGSEMPQSQAEFIHKRGGVFFDVVDDNPAAVDIGVVEGVEDEAGAF